MELATRLGLAGSLCKNFRTYDRSFQFVLFMHSVGIDLTLIVPSGGLILKQVPFSLIFKDGDCQNFPTPVQDRQEVNLASTFEDEV